MESTQYQVVNTEEVIIIKDKESIKSILKQVLISSTVWVQFFMAGLAVGAVTVFIPQLRKQGFVITQDMGTWFYTTINLSVLPFTVIMPLLTQRVGRKIPQIVSLVSILISFLILYLSEQLYQIYISCVFQCALHGVNVSVTILVVTEYCSPKYRGMFLTIKSASFFWGIWVSNAMGTFWHWKLIPLLGILCVIYTSNVFLWPESPFWLASKGRFDECRKAFRWLHGVNAETERHLNEIIALAEENMINDDIGYFEVMKSTEFYKPMTLSLVAVMQYHFSGKIVCTLYVLDIFRHITPDDSTAYTAMLVLDGVTVFGMYIGSFLTKIVNRRTLYMPTSFAGVVFIFLIALYLFMVRLGLFAENKYVTLVLLTLYSLSISCGPMILSMSIYGELAPSKHQATSYIFISVVYGVLYTILVKLAPIMFAEIGVDGAFLVYGVICGLCTLHLYLYLPETKNKTQREIEMYFKDKSKVREASEMM